MRRNLYILILTCLFSLTGYAQTAAPTVVPATPDDEEIIKISTALVQIDATVTDKSGKIVTDLKPEDFEIYANGKKQEITNFSLVNGQRVSKWISAGKTAAPATPLPPITRPEQVRRTIAIVVDDLGLSAETLTFAKYAVKKYISEQIQPGDMVAVISTSKGVGTILQFTTDKRLLDAAVSGIYWNIKSREGLLPGESITSTPMESQGQLGAVAAPSMSDKNVGLMGNELQQRIDEGAATSVEALKYAMASRATLQSLIYIVNGMKNMPGRKSVMFFSDGLAFLNRNASDNPTDPLMANYFEKVIDSATRAAVVINSIDAKGLDNPGLTAADSLLINSTDRRVAQRRDAFRDKTDGLRRLSEDSGGRAFYDGNDLNAGIEKTLGEQTDYYLIGYQPDADAFNLSKQSFNKLEIKLKRPNLRVRYKSGFFAVADDSKLAPTPAQQTLTALNSPFTSSDINLHLNTMFGNDDKIGSYTRSLLHIDAKDLNFTTGADGTHNASLDVYAVSYGADGRVVDQSQKNFKFAVKDELFQKKLAEGFVYEFMLPVKKAGVYQTRVVVRDTATARLGSAFQIVNIPDLSKNKPALSSIIVGSQEQVNNQTADELQAQQTNLLALRQFKKGSVLSYGVELYNVDSNPSQIARLQTQIRILRDNKIILEGRAAPLQADVQPGSKKISLSGALELGRQLAAGEYVLQFNLIDTGAKEKGKYTTQQIYFEITD